MLNIKITLFTFFAFVTTIGSETISDSIAKIVAKNFLIEQMQVDSFNSDIKNIETLECLKIKDINGDLLIFIVNFKEPKGYVALSAESESFPILAFSLEHNFHENNMPVGMNFLFEQYKTQIKEIRKKKYISKENRERWQKYYSHRKAANIASQTIIGPLIPTKWGQNCYYNELLPLNKSMYAEYCNHVPVGCIGVAMAQTIKYYSYPKYAIGTISYRDPDDYYPCGNIVCIDSSYGTINVNLTTSSYDFNKMPNELASSNAEVAKLMRDCSVSVYTDFGKNGSASNMENLMMALMRNFQYAPTLSLIERTKNSSQWTTIIKNELSYNRVVLYSGLDTSMGGHAFIVDGYRSDVFFHINWGWNGVANDWFNLSELTPRSDFITYNFINQSHRAIIGIKPTLFIQGNNYVCINSYIDFSIDYIQGAKYTWQIPTGFSANSYNQNSIRIFSPNSGNGKYQVSVTIEKLGIKWTYTKEILLGPPPQSMIFFRQLGGTCYYEAYTNNTLGVTNYYWSMDGKKWQMDDNTYGNFDPNTTVSIYLKQENQCGISPITNTIRFLPKINQPCMAKYPAVTSSIESSEKCNDICLSSPNDNLFIPLGKTYPAIRVNLIRLDGKIIFSEYYVNQNIIIIKTNMIKPGIYILNLQYDNYVYNYKLLKR